MRFRRAQKPVRWIFNSSPDYDTLSSAIAYSEGGNSGVSPAGVAEIATLINADNAMTIRWIREDLNRHDPDNQDWFWVKYTPEGGIESNPNGIPLAGRVAKDTDQCCIAGRAWLGE